MRRGAKQISEWSQSPVIRFRRGVTEAVSATWGLIPFWFDKELAAKRYDTFNARIETIKETGSYRNITKDKRCLVPVSGFFEFTGPKGHKTRHTFSQEGGGSYLLAGLWDYNKRHDLTTFTIITTEPGDVVRPFHNRMPAIINTSEQAELYLHGREDEALALVAQSNEAGLVVDPPRPVPA